MYNGKQFLIFNFYDTQPLPLIELWAGGCMIDLQYARSAFPKIKRNPAFIAHLFYFLNNNHALIAITKNDATIHYSSNTFLRYFKKIATRIKNNVYRTGIGRGEFLGREQLQPFKYSLKKYLFVPYTLSIVLPLFDAIYLTLTRKKLLYLILLYVHIHLLLHRSCLFLFAFLFVHLVNAKNKRLQGQLLIAYNLLLTFAIL